MIVKIQMPLESTLKNPPCLVYNQDRSVEFHWPIDPQLKCLLGGEPKKYFEARVVLGDLELIQEVEPQPW